MGKRHFFGFGLILVLVLSLVPHRCQAQRYFTVYDSLKGQIASQPDTTRHGFFHATRFNSTFHMQAGGDLTYIYKHAAMLTGFEGAWVVNHKLSLGAKFDIVTSRVAINRYINSVDTISSGTRATPNPIYPTSTACMVTVGYVFRWDRKISVEANLGLGWSHISFSDPRTGWIDTTETKYTQFSANNFIINPAVNVIWNSTKYFRVGATVGAQGVFGKNYLELETYRIRGVYAGLFVRFGTF